MPPSEETPSSGEPSRLLDLPPEVWHDTISWMDGPTRLAFSSVSRSTRNLAIGSRHVDRIHLRGKTSDLISTIRAFIKKDSVPGVLNLHDYIKYAYITVNAEIEGLPWQMAWIFEGITMGNRSEKRLPSLLVTGIQSMKNLAHLHLDVEHLALGSSQELIARVKKSRAHWNIESLTINAQPNLIDAVINQCADLRVVYCNPRSNPGVFLSLGKHENLKSLCILQGQGMSDMFDIPLSLHGRRIENMLGSMKSLTRLDLIDVQGSFRSNGLALFVRLQELHPGGYTTLICDQDLAVKDTIVALSKFKNITHFGFTLNTSEAESLYEELNPQLGMGDSYLGPHVVAMQAAHDVSEIDAWYFGLMDKMSEDLPHIEQLSVFTEPPTVYLGTRSPQDEAMKMHIGHLG